jgi:hypothetical protein
MVFHVQLQWRTWMQDQIDSDTHHILPYFCTGLRTLEQQNNLAWVPSCDNVPQLPVLQHVQHPTPTPRAPHKMGDGGSGSGGTKPPGGAPTGNVNPVPVRVRIRNPARRREFTSNSAMATDMRTRRVAEALALGGDPPLVMHSGVPTLLCVLWHCKGVCFED